MQVEVIPQVKLGNVQWLRIGDVLNKAIAADESRRFRFAVAFARLSGLNRLSVSIGGLLNRGGEIVGAVGVDNGITTIEALEALQQIAPNSTIFYTVSGHIYHPKLYLIEGEKSAVAIVGSANLTRDGLFQNVELATSIHLNFESSIDYEVYHRYDAFISELLNISNPNVQLIEDTTLKRLAQSGIIKPEAQSPEPGPKLRSQRKQVIPSLGLEDVFPPLRIPVAPPAGGYIVQARPSAKSPQVIIPPATVGVNAAFIMQLSAFDCSHRTGIKGTPEVLIPHAAVSFFPPLLQSGRKYPDAFFDVVLNTPIGPERHKYRLWYYEERAIGTRIDEYRLRLDHDTIDLTTPGGGDLLVINKLSHGSDPGYEVTVLPQIDPTFPAFLALCNHEVQGKRWGGL
ncbi:MAG: phospholipase D-like domain-containing protein [Candidatus Competibacteraceae bacterium]